MRPIDRTKHDEDIAERMVGGVRVDRSHRPAQAAQVTTANDHPKTDGRSTGTLMEHGTPNDWQRVGANAAWDARDRRTADELRELRYHFFSRDAAETHRRRLEDEVREERRDAQAKTICAGRVTAPQRQDSDGVRRAHRKR